MYCIVHGVAKSRTRLSDCHFRGCSGLCFRMRAFSSCGEWGLLSSCGVWPSRWGGFSCCGAWALGCVGFSSCGLWAVEHRLSSFGTRA